MAPRNPIYTEFNAFDEQYYILAEKIIKYIKPLIEKGVSVRVAVDRAFKVLKIRPAIKNIITEFMIAAFVKGGIEAVADVDGLKKWFLDKHWPGEKITLSARINKLQFKRIIIDTIYTGVRKADTWTEIANSMTAKQLQTGDIARHVTDLVDASRGVLDTESASIYRRKLKQSAKKISALAQAGAPTKRLKAAYEDVLIATQKGAEKAVDAAIDRAILEKARYNAQRIARTEIARAYGESYKADLAMDEDATGTKWLLSSRHKIFDICNLNANADLYGMGRGVYPKGTLPRYPAHPHCMCVLTKRYKGESGKFNQAGGVKYIDNLSEKRKKELLGVGNYDKYRKNKKDWQKLTPNFDIETDKPSVPKRFLK